VTQKSKSNQDGTQDNVESFKREMKEVKRKEEAWKKNQKTRNSKLDVKSP
jgi:hypothetical protein